MKERLYIYNRIFSTKRYRIYPSNRNFLSSLLEELNDGDVPPSSIITFAVVGLQRSNIRKGRKMNATGIFAFVLFTSAL
jgi:hypothetical protein